MMSLRAPTLGAVFLLCTELPFLSGYREASGWGRCPGKGDALSALISLPGFIGMWEGQFAANLGAHATLARIGGSPPGP